MSQDNKKVFISYRRSLSNYAARSVYQYLKAADYDVFMDVENIGSGEFASVILNQIKARPHFLIILTPGSLERTRNQGDWLRHEIECALEAKRNIVPLFMNKFDYEDEEKRLPGKNLPGKLRELKKYQRLFVHDEYFEDGMKKLIDRFLTKGADIFISATPKSELKTVMRKIRSADKAEVDLKSMSWILPKSKSWKLSEKTVLQAPKLKRTGSLSLQMQWLEWNKIEGASEYILEKSMFPSFRDAKEVYKGKNTSYSLAWELKIFRFGEYYRVKAKGGLTYKDSPWSNVVEVKP